MMGKTRHVASRKKEKKKRRRRVKAIDAVKIKC